MIPRHSLPFDFGKTLSIMVSPTPAAHPSDIEKAYADTLGVLAAILLPSVRAGIHMSILAVNNPGIIAAGPAYTCSTVHEALAMSRADTRLVDSAPGAFLMSSDGIHDATEPGCALALSEVYGIPYDRETLQNASRKGPRVRVFDMAMSIPSPERMKELDARDVALFSFGWGKPMFAGWGGIACFQDPELAGRVREIRDQCSTPESSGFRLKRGCSVLLQVLMNQRLMYGVLHEPHFYRLCRTAFSPGRGKSLLPASPEWTRPMTALNRKLALHNLHHSSQNSELRRSQAELYSSTLVETGIVRGPGSKGMPQSHFPIRIPSALRNTMCDYLRVRGIDTSTLFPLPEGLNSALYHHAAKAADEVVTLPMGPTITLEEVRMVSKCVKDGLKALGC